MTQSAEITFFGKYGSGGAIFISHFYGIINNHGSQINPEVGTPMIKSIQIQNFKSFAEGPAVQLPRFMVLVGDNAA
jgi:hypothetical protein